MEVTMLVSIAFVIVISASTQAAAVTKICLLSESTTVNDLVFKFKTSLNDPSNEATYSIRDNGGFITIPNSKKGLLRLVKDLKRLNLGRDNTRRLDVIVVVTLPGGQSETVTIKFIILRKGFGDGLIGDVLKNLQRTVKDDNIFRPLSQTYKKYRLFHRILLQGSRTSKASSKAVIVFQRALLALIKKVLEILGVSVSQKPVIHLGPEGLLSIERIKELIGATSCIEAIPRPPSCPPDDRFRTINGTCNNLVKTTLGAADIGFSRFVDAKYFDAEGLGEPLGAGDQPDAPELPNPFQVTNDYIIEQLNSQPNRDNTLHMFMQWGQFIDHDMTLAPESEEGDRCEEIECNGEEEDFREPCFAILPILGRSCIRFIRSAAVCQNNNADLKPREQINVNTAYLDASMVYGSSVAVQNAVRDLSNDLGLLLVSGPNRDLLPLDESELTAPNNLCQEFGGCFLAGDGRVNEQASLASIHTLFVREHNRIAKELKILNPRWDGERIYQETRQIVGALVQKITYEDWLPIAIGNGTLSKYEGYDKTVDPGISNAFATAAFRMGHSLIRPTFDFLNAGFEPIHPPIPIVQVFFNNTLIQKEGVDGFLLGAAGNVSQEVDNELAQGLTRKLFQRDTRIGLDLAALNVQRGRDHGLPGYGTFIKRCAELGQAYPPEAINAIRFRDLRDVIRNRTVRNKLRDLYNRDPQNVDLWPAGLAETEIRGTLLGPTFTCLFRDQFERLRDGDRFFYLNIFSGEKLLSIQQTTLASIMCENVNGIVSINRDVFRDRGRRVNCDRRIPRLDLSPWKE